MNELWEVQSRDKGTIVTTKRVEKTRLLFRSDPERGRMDESQGRRAQRWWRSLSPLRPGGPAVNESKRGGQLGD